MDDTVTRFELPGFRFHPTEEELLQFYLRNMIFGKKLHFDVIGFLNIYHHDPWELPGLAKIGEREWYFFVPRDRKHSNGGRPNRTTEHGFWKATGSDRKVVSHSDPKRVIGLRKTLVFYKGRAPRGTKTDWVMNEYRLSDNSSLPKDIVLCKVYRKATSLKVLEQWAAKQEETAYFKSNPQFQGSPYSYPTSPLSSNCTTTTSHYGPHENRLQPMGVFHVAVAHPKQEEAEMDMDPHGFVAEILQENKHNKNICSGGNSESKVALSGPSSCSRSLRLPLGQEALPQLQVPRSSEWAQDPLWAQLCSPWLESILSQLNTPCADILNF